MTQENLDQMTSEELKKYEKVLSTSVTVIGVSVILMVAAGIFITLKRGFNVFTISPVVFLALLIVNYTNLKKVKAALKQRG
ncbi:hypothetical protein ACXZ1K_13785 [Pedobacter sp. PWIIR3]